MCRSGSLSLGSDSEQIVETKTHGLRPIEPFLICDSTAVVLS